MASADLHDPVVPCIECGKPLSVVAVQGKSEVCSRVCLNAGAPLPCPVCGATLPKLKKRYCSGECRAEMGRDRNRTNRKYADTDVEVEAVEEDEPSESDLDEAS